eukprot:TRINITY_DN9075_c0_g1_i1.p2 TRINITY_DN9075_c0_g1~~TRINITY_DN9075_c0_g1_i1.p2  ORF type:complete len:332 (+),score=53.85 TRINITY_DN9075_c0_g1_i1:3679-4674(+)
MAISSTEPALTRIIQHELSKLKDHPDAEPFIKPVDIRFYKDYLDVIENPICIEDIEHKASLNLLDYDQLRIDLNLLISNARKHSSDSTSLFYKMTTRVANEIDLLLARIACFVPLHAQQQSSRRSSADSRLDESKCNSNAPLALHSVSQAEQMQVKAADDLDSSKQAPREPSSAVIASTFQPSDSQSDFIPTLKRCTYQHDDSGEPVAKRAKPLDDNVSKKDDSSPRIILSFNEDDDVEVPLQRSTQQQKALRRRARSAQLLEWKKRMREEARLARAARRAKATAQSRPAKSAPRVRFAEDVRVRVFADFSDEESSPSSSQTATSATEIAV